MFIYKNTKSEIIINFTNALHFFPNLKHMFCEKDFKEWAKDKLCSPTFYEYKVYKKLKSVFESFILSKISSLTTYVTIN